jgi:hypothetical protein
MDRSFCTSVIKRVEFISDRMSHTILGSQWHDIFLNMHAPTEDKSVYIKYTIYEELDCIFNQFPKHHMKILLGDFTAKVGREDIFKPTARNESLNESSNHHGIRVVNFATSKNMSGVQCSQIVTFMNTMDFS